MQSFEEATAPLGEEQADEEEEDGEFSLHFPLEEVKSGLVEVKEKLEEIQMGDGLPSSSRSSRDSRGSCEFKTCGCTCTLLYSTCDSLFSFSRGPDGGREHDEPQREHGQSEEEPVVTER